MATHTSATTRELAHDLTETPNGTQTPPVNQTTRTATIIDALRRRAQAVLNDETIDAQTRAIIRYGLETNDPWLAELVRRANAGEKIADAFDFSQRNLAYGDLLSGDDQSGHGQSVEGPSDGPRGKKIEAWAEKIEAERIEALAELICSAGDESAGALFVLMGTLQHSTHPEVLANTAKHLAFTRCGEFNLFGMVDAQLAVVEGELFARNTTAH